MPLGDISDTAAASVGPVSQPLQAPVDTPKTDEPQLTAGHGDITDVPTPGFLAKTIGAAAEGFIGEQPVHALAARYAFSRLGGDEATKLWDDALNFSKKQTEIGGPVAHTMQTVGNLGAWGMDTAMVEPFVAGVGALVKGSQYVKDAISMFPKAAQAVGGALSAGAQLGTVMTANQVSEEEKTSLSDIATKFGTNSLLGAVGTAALSLGAKALFARASTANFPAVVQQAWKSAGQLMQSEHQYGAAVDQAREDLLTASQKLAQQAVVKQQAQQLTQTTMFPALKNQAVKQAALSITTQLPELRGLIEKVQQAEADKTAFTAMVEKDPVQAGFVYDRPLTYMPGSLREDWENIKSNLFASLQSYSGKLGMNGQKLVNGLIDAIRDRQIMTNLWGKEIAPLMHAAYQEARSDTALKLRPARIVSQELGDAFEKTGADPMELAKLRTQAPARTALLEKLNEIASREYAPLQGSGAKPLLTQQELNATTGGPSAMFVPHSPKVGLTQSEREESLRQGLLAEGNPDANRVAYNIVRNRMVGQESFNSMEFNRTTTGSLLDKVQAGLPIEEDHVNAYMSYLNRLAHQRAFIPRFGVDGRVAGSMIDAAVAEGAPLTLMNSLTWPYMGRNYKQIAGERTMQAIQDFAHLAYIPMVAVRHAGQTVNNLLTIGAYNTGRGILDTLGNLLRGKGATTQAMEMIGVTGGNLMASLRDMGDPLNPVADTPFWKAISWMQNTPYINKVMPQNLLPAVMRLNLAMTTSGVKYGILDDLAMAARGQLRGTPYEAAARRWADMGVDLPSVVATAKANPSAPLEWVLGNKADPGLPTMLQRMIFNGTQQTMFIPSVDRLPQAWNTPLGRLFFQFKGWGFNQSKLVKNFVLSEAAHGNTKPLAYFMLAFPAQSMGNDALIDALSAPKKPARASYPEKAAVYGVAGATGKPVNNVAEYLDASFSHNNWGLLHGLWAQGVHGHLMDTTSPVFGTIDQFTEDFAQGGPAKAARSLVKNLPIVNKAYSIFEKVQPSVKDILGWGDEMSEERGKPVPGKLYDFDELRAAAKKNVVPQGSGLQNIRDVK